jgi:hypothetical protein
MKPDATQKGADGADNSGLRPAYDARFRATQQIARAVHRAYADSGEMHDVDVDEGGAATIGARLTAGEEPPEQQEPAQEPPQAAQEGEQAQGEEQPEPQEQKPQEPAQQAQAPAQEPQQDVEYVTVVVDGERRQVPKASILDAGIRTFQKESAADRRLAEAQRLFRQAQDAVRAAQGQQYAPADDHQLPQNWDAGAQTQPSLDPGTLLSAVDQRLDTELDRRLYLRDAEKAASRFQKDFPEIANDPVLATYVVRLEDERLRSVAAGGMPLGDPWEAYQAHAEAARQWGKARGIFKDPATPTVNKTELKRQIQQVPSANVRAPAPPTEKPRTTRDVIADMAKRRGQRI